jgi:L-alanine-DL-glutamate epimerase-like enolase superfamily enzyme
VGAGEPRIQSVDARTYQVPTDQEEADGTLTWSSTTVVVTQVRAGDTIGLGWTYGAGACRSVVEEKLAEVVTGADPMEVTALTENMARACRNLGRGGVVAGAVSAVDVALWDLKAKLLGVSVATLLGVHRDAVPIYGSGGFTTYDDSTTANQLQRWVSEMGTPSVKIKIGESWGTRPDRDLARVRLARNVIGDSVDLMVDANGGYYRKQAIRLGTRMLEEEGVVWFEEPVSSDDLEGLKEVRDQIGIDVAAGEYGYDLTYFARMLRADAVDCLQADATRCGGFTGWLAAAEVARSQCLQISAHCAPNLHAHVAAAVANLRHIEYFHDHARLDPMLFDGVPTVVDGRLQVDRACLGHGMALKAADAERWRVA